MKKTDYSQLELFSQKDAFRARPQSRRPILAYIWAWEKTILVIIAFVITCIGSFSLGVEKGKSLSFLKTTSQIEQAQSIKTKPIIMPVKTNQQQNQATGSEINQKTTPQPVRQDSGIIGRQPIKPSEQYTIQIASFQGRKFADKEAEILKKKGLTPRISAKGGYSVIYVGSFPNKETAKSSVTQLKKHYKDCFLRRL